MKKYLIPRSLAVSFMCVFVFLAFLHHTGIFSAQEMESHSPLFCPFKTLFHIPCPGCGMTRAMLSLLSGNVLQSVLFHPFSVLFFAWVLLSIIPDRAVRKFPEWSSVLIADMLMVSLVSLLSFWMLFKVLQI